MTEPPSEQNSTGDIAVRRDPVLGEIMLSPCIVAPEHIRAVLTAFGEQSRDAQRRIIIALDEMAIKYRVARDHEPPKKFGEVDADLQALENAARKLRDLWKKTDRDALLGAMIVMVPPVERGDHKFDFGKINVGPVLDELLLVINALRDRGTFARAYSQSPSSHKKRERAILWEPLFDLLRDFGVHNFRLHQPIIETIRALHLACGIIPPEEIAVRQASHDWRKHER